MPEFVTNAPGSTGLASVQEVDLPISFNALAIGQSHIASAPPYSTSTTSTAPQLIRVGAVPTAMYPSHILRSTVTPISTSVPCRAVADDDGQ